MEEKKVIRKKIFAIRQDISDQWVQDISIELSKHLIDLPVFQHAKKVMIYADYHHEVKTDYIIRAAWEAGKQVAVPKVVGKAMVFHLLTDFNQLKPGYFGIPEPVSGEAVCWDEALMIMPGVAFDRKNHRIGYGGGFYDRYLEKHPGLDTVALAFDFQIKDQVPCEITDICPQVIVTETETSVQKGGLDMNEMLEILGKNAVDAENILRNLSTNKKNQILRQAAEQLVKDTDKILAANAIDVQKGRENQMSEGLVDRLMLDAERIKGIGEGLRQVADLDDPIGEVLGMKKRPNGLLIGQKRVPLGVVGIIYEARPNVTADAFALCFKTGNAVILKGGSDAIHSNQAIVESIRKVLARNEVTEDAIALIQDTSRETASEFMKLNQYVDVLIPRGGKGLIQAVVNNSTIPVIETGTGNCHIYVDDSADLYMAADIVMNAKTQRVGVCNACESLLVHEQVKDVFLPVLAERLRQKHVQMRADEAARALIPDAVAATEEDWGREYLDYILSIKVVGSVDEAIAHINKYNTKHSEAIITNNYENAQRFLDEVDAAAVYVNASTRFTDGFEFGFGAEIGISTQKLHARGPMGLNALTTTKYIIYGNGQVR